MDHDIDVHNCEYCDNKGGLFLNSKGWHESGECSYCGRVAASEWVVHKNEELKKRNQGYFFERTQYEHGYRERLFHEKWADLNRAQNGFNSGCTILQLLMSNKLASEHTMRSCEQQRERDKTTERDYKVAATVIQWLGTNIGFMYLQDILNNIKQHEQENDAKSQTHIY